MYHQCIPARISSPVSVMKSSLWEAAPRTAAVSLGEGSASPPAPLPCTGARAFSGTSRWGHAGLSIALDSHAAVDRSRASTIPRSQNASYLSFDFSGGLGITLPLTWWINADSV